MILKLIPKKNFDKKSIKSIKQIIRIAKKLILEWGINIPKKIEFYDSVEPFIKRISNQTQAYGLSKKQAEEFIKASLNNGSYGTFDVKKNSIIEINFNPYFKFFYPARQFLEMIIHESLHLYFYLKFRKSLYNKKFNLLKC